MALRFHQSTFDLLGVIPRPSDHRTQTINERERLCNLPLPASIKEWFCIEGVEEQFAEMIHYKDLGLPSEVSQGYLQVAIEKQGVVAWYAKLDGSDDPPVYHNNDQWDDDFSRVPWEFCSKTFSNFVFDMISGSLFYGWYSGTYLSAIDQFPNTEVIEALGKQYQKGPLSDSPDCKVHRFFNSQGVLRIVSNTPELIESGKALWTIETFSFESLYDFARSVFPFYNLRQTLAGDGSSADSRDKGNDVLKRVREDCC